MPFRLLLFLCCAAGAAAQIKPTSLDDAIRVAWTNDPTVAALSLTPELAHAREEQAGIRPNPEVEFRGGAPVKADSEWTLGFGVNQRLPRRDRVELARAFARLGGATAELRLREQRRLIAGEVRQLYYEAVVLQTRRDLARRTLEAQQALRDSVERRRDAGEITGAETDLLVLETMRAEQALAFAEAELTATTLRLRTRLRWPADTPIRSDASLESLLTRPIPEVPTTLESARPTLALAAHRVRQAEAAVALARSETRGDWTVGGGVDFERRANDYTGRLENEPHLSVSASVPWARTVANRGDIQEKQAALKIAEAELVAFRDELHAELAAASAAARALRPVLAAQRELLKTATTLPDSLGAAYERGEVTSLQLAQARQQRFALETDFLNGAARYAVALAEAETAAGLVPDQP